MCMHVNWKQTAGNGWPDYTEDGLASVDRRDERNCVYLIWSESEEKMVYVGSGYVNRLWDHWDRKSPQDEKIFRYGRLKYTYATHVLNGETEGPALTKKQIRGAEGFLSAIYGYLVGGRHPVACVKVVPPENHIYYCGSLYSSTPDAIMSRIELNNMEALK